MKALLQVLAVLFTALVVAGCSQGEEPQHTPSIPHPPQATASPTSPRPETVEESCLKATIQAINLEIKRYRGWSEGTKDKTKRAQYEARIEELESERKKFASMSPSDYRLPEKVVLTGWFENKCSINAQVYFEGQTRSGPFYHVAGVRNDGCRSISPRTKYEMTMYLVHRRDYPFPDYYVCISGFEKAR